MPSAGLFEQARRGRYRAAPPVVPIPTEAERQQAQLVLAPVDSADFTYPDELADPPRALDRRPAAARAAGDAAAPVQPAAGGGVSAPATPGPGDRRRASAPQRRSDAPGQANPAPASAPSGAPPAAQPPRFAGFRLPGMPGIQKAGEKSPTSAPSVAPASHDRRPPAQGQNVAPQATATHATEQPAAGAATNVVSPTDAPTVRAAEGGGVYADRHAAGVLTRLVSAVVTGNKAKTIRPGEQAKQTLAALIAEAHRLSLELSAAAAGDTPVRRSMQATMLKEASFALARHFNDTGEVSAGEFRQVALDVLDAGASLIPQESLDLLAQSVPNYGDPDSELNYAEDRLRAAAYEVAWQVQRALEDPRLHLGKFFELGKNSPDAETPFTYGRPVNEVRTQLLQAVRRIVDNARPAFSSPLTMARWEEGALARAASLLCAVYKVDTVNLLRTEATADLLGRARANALGRTFELVVAGAERKATAHFVEIERSAPELMRLGEASQVQEPPREVPRTVERERS